MKYKLLTIGLLLMQVISCGTQTNGTIEIKHYCESVPEPDRAECFRDSHDVMRMAMQNRNGNG